MVARPGRHHAAAGCRHGRGRLEGAHRVVAVRGLADRATAAEIRVCRRDAAAG